MMKELTLTADIAALDEVLAFLDGTLEELDCPIKAQMQLDIAVEELYVNIAHYAYTPGTGDATIQIEPTAERAGVSITFMDSGVPYDPLAKPDPDVTLSAEDRSIGGLGIYMVKKSMDDMRYRHEDGKNITTIVKYF